MNSIFTLLYLITSYTAYLHEFDFTDILIPIKSLSQCACISADQDVGYFDRNVGPHEVIKTWLVSRGAPDHNCDATSGTFVAVPVLVKLWRQ